MDNSVKDILLEGKKLLLKDRRIEEIRQKYNDDKNAAIKEALLHLEEKDSERLVTVLLSSLIQKRFSFTGVENSYQVSYFENYITNIIPSENIRIQTAVRSAARIIEDDDGIISVNEETMEHRISKEELIAMANVYGGYERVSILGDETYLTDHVKLSTIFKKMGFSTCQYIVSPQYDKNNSVTLSITREKLDDLLMRAEEIEIDGISRKKTKEN